MSEISRNNRFAPVYGLEPRYLRERKAQPQSNSAEPFPAAMKSLILWHPDNFTCTIDQTTSELRQRLIQADAGSWRRSPLVVVPIMFGISAGLWLALDKLAGLVGHPFGWF